MGNMLTALTRGGLTLTAMIREGFGSYFRLKVLEDPVSRKI